jgi:hypothetical protein
MQPAANEAFSCISFDMALEFGEWNLLDSHRRAFNGEL